MMVAVDAGEGEEEVPEEAADDAPKVPPPSWSQTFRLAIECSDKEVTGELRQEESTGSAGADALRVPTYFAAALAVILLCSALSMGLWSEMGCGAQCLTFMHLGRPYEVGCIFVGVLLLFGLYLFDFFSPPHLPGRHLCLWEGDRLIGRGLFVMALGSFFSFALVIGDSIPTLPILVSMFFSPVCILVLRWLLRPGAGAPGFDDAASPAPTAPPARMLKGCIVVGEKGKENHVLEAVDSSSSFGKKMGELQRLTAGQRDQRNFFLGVGYAYAVAGVLCVLVFVAWWSLQDTTDFARKAHHKERELLYIRWAAPLGQAFSNFVFALLMWLRVFLHRTYSVTDEVRARLIAEAATRRIGHDILKKRSRALAVAGAEEGAMDEELAAHMKGQVDAYLVKQSQRLTDIIKVSNAMMLVIFGALFVSFQFVARDSHLAFFVHGFVGAVALMFTASTMFTFTRLWLRMRSWLQDLPLWRAAFEAMKHPASRALAVMFLLPFVPIMLGLSMLTQVVRRTRGIPNHGARWLTARASRAIAKVAEWNWVPVVLWCYVWGVVFVTYKAVPILLNVFLAWMGEAMEGFDFLLLLGVTFAAGFCLFMLPPVPGPPIYLFGGFVISDRCPWGFAWGAVICIMLCFSLKLIACAVQQKVIGGLMSSSKWVRQTCGVHRPLMRAIERVLKRPGLSLGKVMILSGGPDWPTSVLAGILRVSLLQCELGTTPVIISIITLCLSGSFYLKSAEGEMWMRMGNLMFILTGLFNAGFWAGLAWAIQDEYEKSQDEITKPREEFVELEWLDYRSAKIAERCAVQWTEVPRLIRWLLAAGAALLGCVGHLFFLSASMCFGTFQLGDDPEAVSWFGPDGLIRPFGVLGLYAASGSFTLLLPYKAWRARQSHQLVRETSAALEAEEEGWKARRLVEARRIAASEAEAAGGVAIVDAPEASPKGAKKAPAEGAPPEALDGDRPRFRLELHEEVDGVVEI